MNPLDLQQTLGQLHDELSKTTQVDDATRQALTVVMSDIQKLVTSPAEQPAPNVAPAHSGVSAKLQSLIEDFEVRHPSLAGIIQQVVDRLAEMGI